MWFAATSMTRDGDWFNASGVRIMPFCDIASPVVFGAIFQRHIVAQVTPAVSGCVAHAHGVGSLSWLSKHSPLPARSLRCSLPVWKLWTSVCKVALELVSANWTRTSHMHTSIAQQTSNTVCSVNTVYVKSVPGYCATSLLYATGLVTCTLECTLILGVRQTTMLCLVCFLFLH